MQAYAATTVTTPFSPAPTFSRSQMTLTSRTRPLCDRRTRRRGLPRRRTPPRLFKARSLARPWQEVPGQPLVSAAVATTQHLSSASDSVLKIAFCSRISSLPRGLVSLIPSPRPLSSSLTLKLTHGCVTLFVFGMSRCFSLCFCESCVLRDGSMGCFHPCVGL